MKWIRLLLAAILATGLLYGCSINSEQIQEDTDITAQISDTILDDMEGPPKGGHTIARHVGKTEQELKERVQKDNISAASTYYDKETATKAVQEALRIHEEEIGNWLDNSDRDRLVLNTEHSFDVGKSVLKSNLQVIDQIRNTITVLVKDPESDLRYKILTSYPNAKRGK
ncbi:MAG: RNase A-like domain-containing lipoprotein [Bacillus sp. (in: firmicutes)]